MMKRWRQGVRVVVWRVTTEEDGDSDEVQEVVVDDASVYVI